MTLLEKLQNLPQDAGIYQYFDKNGKLLYIGKAKVLKNRVKSYFRFTPELQPSPKLEPRIYKMISEVDNMHYIVVDSESDALILENSLIKQLKPKYNGPRLNRIQNLRRIITRHNKPASRSIILHSPPQSLLSLPS